MTDQPGLSALQNMKREGRKIVGVVAWDFPMAQIAERAGADLVSVGDSVGVNLWGHASAHEITLEEMLVVCKAVRRGVKRALVNMDLPERAQNLEAAQALRAAGADLVKIADEKLVAPAARAGIAVFAEFHGGETVPVETLVERAKRLEQAGAALLDFRHSGPVAGEAVTRAVQIPVIGGLGGGPWLDGRMRMALAAIGYLESRTGRYADVARTALEALSAYANDVRAGRQLRA